MYGLLGKKLSHSFSPQIHSKIDDYEYVLIEKEEDEIEEFINSKSYKGLNITIPYKAKLISFCDELSDTAKKIGCINTLINKDGKLYGYNTDYYGLISMIKHSKIDVKGKKALILGTGATSKTTAIVLKDLGVKQIVKLSRNITNIDGDIKITDYQDYNSFKDSDIIINCTPVGMYPNNLQSNIDLDKFTNLQAVCDVVYNPLSTKLILDAKQRNIQTSDGLIMLVSQAIHSARLFTGKDYDFLEDKIVNSLKKQMSNIVLIGMPGSGKTSIGLEIAKMSGKKFVDIDELIKKEEQKEIAEIFDKFGEKYFREKEKSIIFKVSKENNQIISTGGGAVLDKENYYPLKQNSIIFYIDRDLKDLSIQNRPLSKGGLETLEKLFKTREALYLNFSDKIVKNKGIEFTANKIMEEYNEIFNY